MIVIGGIIGSFIFPLVGTVIRGFGGGLFVGISWVLIGRFGWLVFAAVFAVFLGVVLGIIIGLFADGFFVNTPFTMIGGIAGGLLVSIFIAIIRKVVRK